MSVFLSSMAQRTLSATAWAVYILYCARTDFFPWLFGKAWFLLLPVGVVWYADRLAAEMPLPAFVMRRNPIQAQQRFATFFRSLGWLMLLLPWLGVALQAGR